MKQLTLFLLFLSGTLLFSSCFRDVFCVEGKGELITEEFVLDDFIGIDLEESGNVTIIQGEEQKVVVTAHENILDRLKTRVEGGIWDINLGRQCFDQLQLDIEITVPVIEEVHISGSGNITVGDFTQSEDLELSILGSGDIDLGRFTGVRNLEVKISGSGEINANEEFPNIEKVDFNISGSGLFDGYDLVTKELDARISGSGDIYTTVTEKITIRISGSGDLHYKGNPLIDANITGSGQIIDEN